MSKENKQHQGEIFRLLLKRAGIKVDTMANLMDLRPSSLSRMFKNESLSTKVIRKASQILKVEESVFETGVGYSLPNTTSVAAEDRPELEAELQRLEEDNKRLAAQLLREQEINDDLRVLLRRVIGEDAGKSDQDKL